VIRHTYNTMNSQDTTHWLNPTSDELLTKLVGYRQNRTSLQNTNIDNHLYN